MRFIPRGVEDRGWRVAVVEDTRTGELARVYKRLGKWRHWDRRDEPVKVAALRRAGRELLH